MKEKKRVFRSFRYRECDAFADYLNEQARQGWYFKEWRLGLVFEKGTPKDMIYAVEVFPDGAEMDTKPEPETEEYADYCDAAGWKLIDSKRRFCIFLKEKPDACPIVTPEERFQNIKKAEFKRWFHSSAGVILITALDWIQFWTLNFERWILNDLMMLCLLMVSLVFLAAVLELAVILVWAGKTKRLFSKGIVPVYGGRTKGHPGWKAVWGAVYYAVMCIFAYFKGMTFVCVWLTMFAGGLLLICIIIEMIRPSRADNWLIQFGAEGGLVFLVILISGSLVFGKDTETIGNVSLEEFPLSRTDYREAEGEPVFADMGRLDGVFGTEEYYMIEYSSGEDAKHDSGEIVSDGEEDTDSLMYDIYRTQSPWILRKLWQSETKSLSGYQADSDPWDAAAVYRDSAGSYWVLYPDTMLILYDSISGLDEVQIQIVREKLGLNE